MEHILLVNIYVYIYIYLFFFGAATQREPWPPHSWGFLDRTQRRTTVGRTPLDEWSARRIYIYIHKCSCKQRNVTYLRHDFNDMIFKIKRWFYSLRVRPQKWETLVALLNYGKKYQSGRLIVTYVGRRCYYKSEWRRRPRRYAQSSVAFRKKNLQINLFF